MTVNEKRWTVIGGLIAGGLLIWLLLQRAGVIAAPASNGFTPGTISLGGNNVAGGTDTFNIGGPGGVSFNFSLPGSQAALSSPTAAGSADGATGMCNCPDVNSQYYGDTTDQAGGISQQSITDLLTSLGATLDKVLPQGASNAFGGATPLQNRYNAYKAAKAEYNTPVGDINAAFAAMNLG